MDNPYQKNAIIEKNLVIYKDTYGTQKMGPEKAKMWSNSIGKYQTDAIDKAFRRLFETERYAFHLPQIHESIKARMGDGGRGDVYDKPLPSHKPMPDFAKELLKANEAMLNGELEPDAWYSFVTTITKDSNAFDKQAESLMMGLRDHVKAHPRSRKPNKKHEPVVEKINSPMDTVGKDFRQEEKPLEINF